MSWFSEVADRVWVARHEWCDVNLSVIEGTTGLLVVDTLGSGAAAREAIAEVRRLSSLPVVEIVNTHAHFDHFMGNAAFRGSWKDVPITAHESAAEQMASVGASAKRSATLESDPRFADLAATPVLAAETTFSSVRTIDLGERSVELVHPGRGHTGGDLVVRIEDADVLLAGDLLEEASTPVYGEDCYPMDWPSSLDLVLSLTGSETLIVPGHGAPVNRDFATEQRSAIGVVAETIRDLAGRGVPLSQALAAAEWPYPAESLAEAVRRGYEQLPRMARQLPLI
ncbi:MAG: MBL fold metallo-hydrolase [Marmoricola sp.]